MVELLVHTEMAQHNGDERAVIPNDVHRTVPTRLPVGLHVVKHVDHEPSHITTLSLPQQKMEEHVQ